MARRDSLTGDLFEIPVPAKPLPCSMNFRAEVSSLVAEMLKGHDRHEVAALISRLTGLDISKNMLDAYASEARDTFNIPFYLIPVLETACETYAAGNWYAQKRGAKILVGREALNAELGRLEKRKEETATRIKQLKKQMGITR